jgi:hypothetical protein
MIKLSGNLFYYEAATIREAPMIHLKNIFLWKDQSGDELKDIMESFLLDYEASGHCFVSHALPFWLGTVKKIVSIIIRQDHWATIADL